MLANMKCDVYPKFELEFKLEMGRKMQLGKYSI